MGTNMVVTGALRGHEAFDSKEKRRRWRSSLMAWCRIRGEEGSCCLDGTDEEALLWRSVWGKKGYDDMTSTHYTHSALGLRFDMEHEDPRYYHSTRLPPVRPPVRPPHSSLASRGTLSTRLPLHLRGIGCPVVLHTTTDLFFTRRKEGGTTISMHRWRNGNTVRVGIGYRDTIRRTSLAGLRMRFHHVR